MKKLTIPKRGQPRKFRTVWIPSRWEKSECRKIAVAFMRHFEAIPTKYVVHGFVPGRSPVTNALAHVGFRYSLSLDIADFFDSVTTGNLTRAGFCHDPLLAYWDFLCGGRARQGLPCSPMAANIAASPADRAFLALISTLAEPVAFTRYADDLTFSSSCLSVLLEIRKQAPVILKAHGFTLNPKKTRLQYADFGRRIICGVAVGDKGIYPTRRFRRKLRAALHQYPHTNKTRGLQEWGKLKPPRSGGPAKLGKIETQALIEQARKAFADLSLTGRR